MRWLFGPRFMADKTQLRILDRGVGAWNEWRRANPTVLPDLSNASLNNRNLNGAHLEGGNLERILLRNSTLFGANLSYSRLCLAKLTRANLSEADLSGADLGSAGLFGADLSGANLSHAKLDGANLRRVNLTGAKLNSANLTQVSFQNANLSNADLTSSTIDGAVFHTTVFGNTNLSAVRGLEYCKHRSHSIIDQLTLARSGELPRTFLKGCGLPDIFLEYFPALLNDNPIKFYSCFISYSAKNESCAQKLFLDLQNKGLRCWYAPESLKIGDKTRESIDASIRLYEKLLLILSKHSIESTWVEKEVETALERERELKRTILFPIRLDNHVMKIQSGWAADIRRSRNIGDFRRWKDPEVYKKAFNRLLRDLRAEM